jgi:hypothetical protein
LIIKTVEGNEMPDESKQNILKVREDNEYIALVSAEKGNTFTAVGQASSSWFTTDKANNISMSDLRVGIEPWLTSLFQSEHLSLMVGNGLSTAVHIMAAGKGGNAMSEPTIDTEYKERIEATAKSLAEKNNRGKANIEDYIRVINELLRGLEVLGHDSTDEENKAKYDKLSDELDKIIKRFADSINDMENSIAVADDEKRKEAFDCLVNFLMSFASRTGTRERLNIFTTNYDRLIEAGSEIAGLHLLDRFVGSISPIFRSSRLDIDMHYNPPGIRGEPRYLEGVARFTKLHGSIDWIDTGMDIRRIGLPFGSKDIGNFLNAPGIAGADVKKIMIYPNAAKDRETTEYPYIELFRDFAAALCRPNSTLVTYGYGFGDDHINRVIRDMLTIPSTHLVIISYDDAGNRIMKKYAEFGRHSQISLIIGNGLANLKTLVNHFLPKPAIDKTSIRMSELLKQRYQTNPEPPKNDDGGEAAE